MSNKTKDQKTINIIGYMGARLIMNNPTEEQMQQQEAFIQRMADEYNTELVRDAAPGQVHWPIQEIEAA